MEVPTDMETGVYSNVLSIWSGPHDFTLDFAVTGRGEEKDGQMTVPCRIVSRVKIPHSMAQDVLRTLATHVTNFEAAAGRIPRLGDDQPTYPPEDFK